jgi:hypothetical protein
LPDLFPDKGLFGLKCIEMLIVRAQKFFSNGPNLLGFLGAIAGVLALVSLLFIENESSIQKTIWIGLSAISFGGVLMSVSSGKMVDFKNSRFREYFSVLGFYSGKWESLPAIERVELIHHSFTSQNVPNGITPTFKSQVTIYKVVLFSEQEVLLTLDYDREINAVAAMEKISKHLN